MSWDVVARDYVLPGIAAGQPGQAAAADRLIHGVMFAVGAAPGGGAFVGDGSVVAGGLMPALSSNSRPWPAAQKNHTLIFA